jgi:hypothetical protein
MPSRGANSSSGGEFIAAHSELLWRVCPFQSAGAPARRSTYGRAAQGLSGSIGNPAAFGFPLPCGGGIAVARLLRRSVIACRAPGFHGGDAGRKEGAEAAVLPVTTALGLRAGGLDHETTPFLRPDWPPGGVR